MQKCVVPFFTVTLSEQSDTSTVPVTNVFAILLLNKGIFKAKHPVKFSSLPPTPYRVRHVGSGCDICKQQASPAASECPKMGLCGLWVQISSYTPTEEACAAFEAQEVLSLLGTSGGLWTGVEGLHRELCVIPLSWHYLIVHKGGKRAGSSYSSHWQNAKQ